MDFEKWSFALSYRQIDVPRKDEKSHSFIEGMGS